MICIVPEDSMGSISWNKEDVIDKHKPKTRFKPRYVVYLIITQNRFT